MKLRKLIFRYFVFAIVAIFMNLATQRLILSFGEGDGNFAIALIFGTIIGLIVKYILDKRWIYKDLDTEAFENAKKFFRYTLMGIFTTLLFWLTEAIFWNIWRTDSMREIGAITGLLLGYYIKFNLDKRFVFKNTRLA